MPVSPYIIAQVGALSTTIKAAGDLRAASFDTLNGLAWAAGMLASTVEAAIDPAAGALDTFAAPLMPQDIAAGVLALADACNTQTTLSDLEGYIARIEINLENRT